MKDGRHRLDPHGAARDVGPIYAFSRRQVGAMLLGILAASPAPTAFAYAQPGEDVRVVDLDWINGTRARSVPARLSGRIHPRCGPWFR